MIDEDRTLRATYDGATRLLTVALALAILAPNARSQEGHPASHADSARADSLARQDSLIHRELERIRREGRPLPTLDTGARTAREIRLDAAVIADLIGDFTTEGSTLESGRRFEVRDVHLAVGAAIDADFRGDFMMALDHESRVVLMEGALSTTSLPWGLQVRAGRFPVPFGRQNAAHRVFLPTIDYPHVIQRFFGTHGAGGTGVSVGVGSGWLGFRQEIIITALEAFPEPGHAAEGEHAAQGHVTFEPRPAWPANRSLQGLGYTARLRAGWDITPTAELEVSVSGGTGRSTQPFGCEAFGHYEPCPAARGETGVNARRSVLGAHLTLRWHPGGAANAPALVIQSELMRQQNSVPRLPRGAPAGATYLGPSEDPAGAYALARFQASSRLYVVTRYDWVESVVVGERNTVAGSAYLQYVPSDLTKLVLGFERVRPPFGNSLNRILFQTAIGVGTRGAHAH